MTGSYGHRKVSTWKKLVEIEVRKGAIERARRLWEDALSENYKDHHRYILYADFELKNNSVNKARNVFERAVQQLPRFDELWYKYVKMEEDCGNLAGARKVYGRWMGWVPECECFQSYIDFELRHYNIEGAREVYRQFVQSLPFPSVWIRYITFEREYCNVFLTRKCYEEALDSLGDEYDKTDLFLSLADFETECHEIEPARFIFKLVLEGIPEHRVVEIMKKNASFEEQYGDLDKKDDAIYRMRRVQYEKLIEYHPFDYDNWIEYISLEENGNNRQQIEYLYVRSIANVPAYQEKQKWKLYIQLWIGYASYEEVKAEDMERTRSVYNSTTRPFGAITRTKES